MQAVREDPKRAGLLYAGTEHGIYVSFDNGAEWQSLRLNLPDTQVSDLVIEGDDLVIATHGRAFYILDDITPLRQLSAGVLSTGAHLFAPHPVVRSRRIAARHRLLSGEGSRHGEDRNSRCEAARWCAPSSARRRKRRRSRRTRRRCCRRRRRRRWQGAARFVRRRAKQGGNRFTWDLRYPGANTFEGMIFWGAQTDQGPLAVPGQYQVRLTANGVTETRPLIVSERSAD